MLMECQISDPTLTKGYNAPRSAGAPAGHSDPRLIPDEEVNPKKRKREAPDQPDAKLREFLHVMKAGREGVITDEPHLDSAGSHFETGEAAVPEAESDDEYEKIPTRNEKSRRIGSPTNHDRMAHPGPQRDGKTHDAVPAADAVDPATDDNKAPAPDATDDDWLRSRTSRLLDLVDPDDITADATPRPEDGSAKRDTENGRDSAHSSDEMTHDVAEDAAATNEVARDDAVDAISRTSRLFVRNLPYSATEEDLRDTFEKFGTLQEVRGDPPKFSFFMSPEHKGAVMNPDRDSLYFGI